MSYTDFDLARSGARVLGPRNKWLSMVRSISQHCPLTRAESSNPLRTMCWPNGDSFDVARSTSDTGLSLGGLIHATGTHAARSIISRHYREEEVNSNRVLNVIWGLR